MPISSEKRKRYGADWRQRVRFIVSLRARNRCEWCMAENRQPNPATGSVVVLTVAHIHDKRPECTRFLNLRALCQKCHLTYDAGDRCKGQRKRRPVYHMSGRWAGIDRPQWRKWVSS